MLRMSMQFCFINILKRQDRWYIVLANDSTLNKTLHKGEIADVSD
jgi:hypothetical protein